MSTSAHRKVAKEADAIAEAQYVARARALASSGEAREIRLAANLSLREFAAMIGSDSTTVRRYENGVRVHAKRARRYCLALDTLAHQNFLRLPRI